MSQQIMPVVSIVSEVVDDLPDFLVEIERFIGTSTTIGSILIGGFNGGEQETLRHEADIDDTDILSVHLFDNSTPYQNTSGKDAYFVLQVRVTGSAGDRIIEIYSSDDPDSLTTSTLLQTLDSSGISEWDATGDKLSSQVLVVPTGRYITIQNISGTTGFSVDIEIDDGSIVVEQTP